MENYFDACPGVQDPGGDQAGHSERGFAALKGVDAIRSFSSAVTRTLRMCVFRFCGETSAMLEQGLGKGHGCEAMKAPVGLSSGHAVCDSRWRGNAPTSSVGFVTESVKVYKVRQDGFANFIAGMR